jgi:hypothetical protein
MYYETKESCNKALQTQSKYYLKYQDSIIKDNGKSIFELNIKLLIALLMDQKKQYDI